MRIELESGENQTPKVLSETVIANGIPWVDSAEALVLGPTGLALASDGTLYVASTEDNKIFAISEAMTRTTPAAKGGTVLTEGGHLKEPLGLVLAPNGNIITSNGGDGNMVETTPAGQQVAVQTADKKTGAGSLFGFVIAPEGKGIYFVDDGENTLNLLDEGQAAAARLDRADPGHPTKAAASRGLERTGNLSLEANAEGQLKYNTTSLTPRPAKSRSTSPIWPQRDTTSRSNPLQVKRWERHRPFRAAQRAELEPESREPTSSSARFQASHGRMEGTLTVK